MPRDSLINPFTVQTPENITATDAIQLFVDVFTDFHKIRDPGHSMLNGPRGCGKSMMFRYLQPDCQQLNRHCNLKELPFFAVLVSIKNTDLNLTELLRLLDHNANAILNEHFLTMYVAARTALALSKADIENSEPNRIAARAFFYDCFLGRLRLCGLKDAVDDLHPDAAVSEIFKRMWRLCDRLFAIVIAYMKQLSFPRPGTQPYDGPLCGYLDFLYPLFEDLREQPYMPHGPVYLLMDDADYLNHVQTLILNTWVSSRTSATVSIKISTQLKYKPRHQNSWVNFGVGRSDRV